MKYFILTMALILSCAAIEGIITFLVARNAAFINNQEFTDQSGGERVIFAIVASILWGIFYYFVDNP